MTIKTAATWALAAALGGTVLLNPVSPASAGPGSGHKWLERLQTKLELNDDQTRAIEAIYARDAETRRQLVRSMRQAQTDLRRLALNSTDPTAIQQKEAEVAGLLAQGVQLRVQHLQEIAPLLTPEQRDRFAELPMAPGMPRPPQGHPARGTSS
jgi:Spy/CpxP family protein refolding chaperone